MHQNRLAAGIAYSAPPDSLAGYKGPTSKAPTSKGRGWKRRVERRGGGYKMTYVSVRQKPSRRRLIFMSTQDMQ